MRMAINKDLFERDVYNIVSAIPYGKVITYGQIATLSGYSQYARMVGRVLSCASSSEKLPFHRVVNSQGRLAPHWSQQRILLMQEGVIFKKNGCVNMKKCHWDFMNEDVSEF